MNDNVIENLKELKETVNAKKYALQRIIDRNDEKLEKAKLIDQDIEMLNKIETYFENYKQNLSAIDIKTKNAYSDSQNRKISYLEDKVNYFLSESFEDDNYEVSIRHHIFRNKEEAELLLYTDGDYDNPSIPSVAEGGHVNEILAFGSAIGILECKGSRFMCQDEAFSEASEKRRGKLGKFYERLANKGMQIFLVSQVEQLYSDLTCRLHYIQRNKDTNETSLVNCVDQVSETENEEINPLDE